MRRPSKGPVRVPYRLSTDAGIRSPASMSSIPHTEILPEKSSEVGNLAADSIGHVSFGTFDARGIELVEFLPRVTRLASLDVPMAH